MDQDSLSQFCVSVSSKRKERDKLAKLVDEFLERGGEITHVEPQATGDPTIIPPTLKKELESDRVLNVKLSLKQEKQMRIIEQIEAEGLPLTVTVIRNRDLAGDRRNTSHRLMALVNKGFLARDNLDNKIFHIIKRVGK